MASRKAFSIENPDAMADALRNLETTFSESTLRKAGATGATILKDEVVARTPRDSGELAEGCTVVYAPEDSVSGKIATYVVTFVGVYPPQKNGKPGPRKRDVAGWLENGHANRISAIENGTSSTPAQPFVRPAYEAKRGQAVAATQAVISDALEGKA